MMRLMISETLSPYVSAVALITAATAGLSMITICSVYLAGGDGIAFSSVRPIDCQATAYGEMA
jgi:hypothetical protein